MNFELELKGFKELESTFADLARKDEKIHKATVKAGGAVLAEVINDNAPRSAIGGKHPHIDEDIIVGNRIKRDEDGEIYAVVGPTKDTKYRVHLPEFGTIHQAANPFIRNSMVQANDKMLDAMEKVIKAGYKL
ncbi:HK97 gp10 family phage protein [Bacillus subtilis]|uniref:HK97 gp10 family phage protein n=1 Tax=Bacillus halotolerans TaxID=260554 RepID=A0ABY7I5C6_9BACI|nr:HK97-gp10 family putative phage morphogenesis protein [Bacillus halotolerans]MDG0765385.1 HK97 gp10 family phage protein [Bacillus halotolerans]MED3513103.1 HK97 gp10 family phage protein [Bacillus subtilis]MED3518372.1 HK97 gp10 family phage protein [Bacillus subtilis]WAT23169.1 HK97 gp10 family phage protein [Bacillus halotolerans]